MTWFEAALRWYAVLAALTWALAPAVSWLCDALSDRGLTIIRPLAVLAAVYPVWLLAALGLAAFNAPLVIAAVIVLGVISWSLTLLRSGVDRNWLRQLAIVEGSSALLFAAYVWLRGYTPAILGTEKPMDIAFLASSSRAVTMPPLDPWFAGEPINYYYLGYVLHGTVGRLADVPPETGFNLALATVFSCTLVAAFGVVWNVVRPWVSARLAAFTALFATFGVGLAGNLYAPMRLLQDPSSTITAWWWDGAVGIGWRSSRIVCDGLRVENLCPNPATATINEFPFFSFLLGDLHPHVMALPYTLVAISLSWNLAQTSLTHSAMHDWTPWPRVAVCGAVAGALYPLNAWDYPTFLVLMLAGVWIGAGTTLARAWRPSILLVASSLLAWLPFLATFVPPTTSASSDLPALIARVPGISSALSALGLHTAERTSTVEYLTIFGVPYVLGVALIVSGFGGQTEDLARRELRAVIVPGAAMVVAGVLLSAPVIPLCGIPLALAIAQLRRDLTPGPRVFALVLYSVAWALSIGVEVFYVRDAFDDRMNTLFKFYYQSWTLSAIGAAIAVVLLWVATAGVPRQRAVLVGASVLAVAAGAVYPAVASYQWTDRFRSWQGLDGLAYGEAESPDEVAAIRWLSQNAQPGDSVLEVAGCSYHPFGRLPFNRVSAFTGIPTVIGWDNHERQWRAGQPAHLEQIGERQSEVAALFGNPDSALVDEYGIQWLFVGEFETGNWQAECDTAGPYESVTASTFPGPNWDEVFSSGDIRLFRRTSS